MKPSFGQVNSTLLTKDDVENEDKIIGIDNNNNNNNNNSIIINSNINFNQGDNKNELSIINTIKTPAIWLVGALIYFYFILFQLFSTGLSSMGYDTIPLNNRFLNKRLVRLIPNNLRKRNKQIGLIYNRSNNSGGINLTINSNNNNINNNNNNNNSTISSYSSDRKSFNILRKVHFKRNFIVFISITDNDRSAINVFNKVRPMFDNSQIGLSVFETESKSDTFRISYRIQQTEFDGIVCVGDDNLIHDVVNCIFNKQDYTINRHIPIGIIPSGKKNGFSNSLGITSPEMATNIILQGNVNYIDIMSASPIRNTNQLSFPNQNQRNNTYNNIDFSFNNNNDIDIYQQNNNNNQNLNNYNNIFFNEFKVYSILYIGWGAISFRDKFKPWNSNIKPWLLSSIYSKFSNFSLNNFASSLYFLPSPHFSNIQNGDINNNLFENQNSLYCNKKSMCNGCRKKYIDYDFQGKRSSKDFSDWKLVEGIDTIDNNNNNNSNNDNNNNRNDDGSNNNSFNSNGTSYFLAGNLSHISKNFKAFPYSHFSDGFLDLLISNQSDKKKLNQLIYDPNPSKDLFSDDGNLESIKTSYYCKTKEIIINVKNQDIPISIDGELFDIKEFGSSTIKVQSHRGLCAIFS
ncbi:hypothetical protein RB653_008898 [Dictyostelium firmibasis]|uniref:DAGKc domain-containing protein n=1 Tax=Dictyostelium firmibasis TaxID=79012 RepID=A0AAN7TT97_9MYCE